MRRNRLALMMILTSAIGGLAVSATPAGAAPFGGPLLHAGSDSSVPATGGHVTSPVPPLTQGFLEFFQISGQSSYVPAGVQAPTDPSTNGSTLDFALTGTVPGVGPSTVQVSVTTGSSTQPLQVGSTYGTGHTGTMTMQIGSVTCTSGPSPGKVAGEGGAVRIDQLTEVGGVVTSAAVMVGCGYEGFVVPGVLGSLAYNAVPTTPHRGYYTYESNGALTGFGNDSYLNYLGDLSFVALNQPIVGMAQTVDGGGYWMVAADGGIFAYGDAGFYGSAGNLALNQPIVGMASTADGKGYWLVAADGGTFAYGDAGFYGSAGNLVLNQPIVGMASTADGKGYWLVAADGGIFAYGDATFHGSTGNLVLNQPIVGMAITNTGTGYWLVAGDGGIFGFNAPFWGSFPSQQFGANDVVGLSTLPGIGA